MAWVASSISVGLFVLAIFRLGLTARASPLNRTGTLTDALVCLLRSAPSFWESIFSGTGTMLAKGGAKPQYIAPLLEVQKAVLTANSGVRFNRSRRGCGFEGSIPAVGISVCTLIISTAVDIAGSFRFGG